MAGKLRDALNCDGFNVVQNNGEIAGQTVFHFHMHLIPRYEEMVWFNLETRRTQR